MVVLSTLITLVMLALPTRYKENSSEAAKRKHDGNTHRARLQQEPFKASIQVLVLGDIGRSPRMQYHAKSIAEAGNHVEIIGYRDSELDPALLSNALVTVLEIPPPPALFATQNNLVFLLVGPLKVLWQIWHLWFILAYRTNPARWLLVQNPPSIPTLAVASVTCWLRNTRLMIDWHNLGWSILALRLGKSHALVRVAQWYERYFGQFASANLTVTHVMARSLRQTHGLRSPIIPLHDRPAAHFQPLQEDERAHVLLRLPQTAQTADAILASKTYLLVSSTSWTADEDFSILLDAFVAYSASALDRPAPAILAIITGKGPMQAHYLQRISSLTSEGKLGRVSVLTAWFSTADYASLLASADLGISLHVSSSGLDLPMKVVDMFGCGLPVVGWSDFAAWPELVSEGVNGRGFTTAADLTRVLTELLGGDRSELRRLKEGAVATGKKKWDDGWKPVVGRILELDV
ncbi:MAG: mannosyltransferase [Phylliscum demangeonii]|nr:MAG: mannosyltransferase [Phylliscum demangeonii]